MSTRSSILCDDVIHLFEDVACDYAEEGLHLDITPDGGAMSDYGDFALSAHVNGVNLHLRLPVEVCEAIADFVMRRREWMAKVSP